MKYIIYLIISISCYTGVWAQSIDNGSYNTNQNNNTLNNSTENLSLTNPAIGGLPIFGSPSAFSNSGYYNSPWNFTPPAYLFHPTKTINDHSAFHRCRLINLSTSIHDSLKDKVFGIFDEKEYISTGVGKLKGAPPNMAGNVVACGLNTQVSPSCVKYIGTGYVLLDNYASTEAALVGISKMAATKGANLIANLNCPYQESMQGHGSGGGLALGNNQLGDFIGTVGGAMSTSSIQRKVQPHCNGDFYLVVSECRASEDNNYMPTPRPYRRYLPSNNPQLPQPTQKNKSINGLW